MKASIARRAAVVAAIGIAIPGARTCMPVFSAGLPPNGHNSRTTFNL